MNEKFINSLFSIPYVLGGRTKEGADCWGLVVICYKELFNIDLPTYDNIALSVSNGNVTAKEIRQQIESSAPFIEVGSPEYGDFVLINMLGNPVHIGFMIDNKTMVHTQDKIGVCSDDIRGPKWKRRIQGYYRHNSLIL